MHIHLGVKYGDNPRCVGFRLSSVPEDDDSVMEALSEPHVLPLQAFDRSPIEVECTSALRRPPPNSVLSLSGSERVLLLQFSLELLDSAGASPSEAKVPQDDPSLR